MSQPTRVVHKFGGSSLAGAERIRRVVGIVTARPEPERLVVVSAMGGVTDALVRAVHLAAMGDAGYRTVIEQVRASHLGTLEALLPQSMVAPIVAAIDHDVGDILDVLRAAALLRGQPRETLELVSGYGEIWSAQIVAAAFAVAGEQVEWLDAREVLMVTRADGGVDVVWDASRARVDAWLARMGGLPGVLVITGFVASTTEGTAATLGRNGSDYSASVFASLLDAGEIHIWTDVDGVMSANPRLVAEAVTLETLSYDEAMELAYFGAKVIHPRTMAPAVARGIPIFIRNAFEPGHIGTRIHASSSPDLPVKGLATVESIALLNLEGTGMIGVPGTAHRLFGALRDEGISVVMISQGSSEHSICFAVPAVVAERAREAVERAFLAEVLRGQIQRVDVTLGCSILAVVGDGMAGRPGVAARFFSALGKAGVSLRAIAQGASERNISVIVDEADTQRALRAAHAGFYLSDQTLSIGLVGAGNVGTALLRQLAQEAPRLQQERDLDLRVRAIATSGRMVLSDHAIDLADDAWRQSLEQAGEPLDLDRLAAHVHAEHLPHAVLIDCTASDAVARCYGEWLERGIHVITPNKRANTGPIDYYRRLRQANRAVGAHYLYETTVGAALPIIQTLRDLVQTGDTILGIEGILSGTLSYLCNRLDGSAPFSALLARARELGYTEPDPRDDLSGMDVARKVVILAREMGLSLEIGDVDARSLVPEMLRAGSITDFLDALPAHDAAMEALRADAASRGEVLRFVGRVDADGAATVALRAYPASHPFARIQLTDNIVLFRTSRYQENPLVVQGPGAGREVTAAGVFADLLRLASYLGAPV